MPEMIHLMNEMIVVSTISSSGKKESTFTYQKSLIFTILVADCPQGATGKFTSDRKSIKSVGTGGSGGRRSSSSLAPANANSGPVSSNSLGSNFASAASGSSSGGKRSLHSGGYYLLLRILFFSF